VAFVAAIALSGCSAGSSATSSPDQATLGNRSEVQHFFENVESNRWTSLHSGPREYQVLGEEDGCSIVLKGPSSSSIVNYLEVTCPASGGVAIAIPTDQVKIVRDVVKQFAPTDLRQVEQVRTVAASSELSTVGACHRSANRCPGSPTMYLTIRSSQPPGNTLPAVDLVIMTPHLSR
jgi:hypothetical protein